MKLFKKPAFALFLTVIVVIASTLINTNIKFGRKCSEVSDLFYEGVTANGYTQTPIATHLENIAGYADGLCTIARNYDIDTASVEDSSSFLKWSLQYNDTDTGYIHSNYTQLSSELATLVDRLERTELSDRDASGVEQYKTSISGAQSAIGESGYNDAVRSFLRRYDHFPTDVLAEMAGVEMPETFAG